MTSISPAQPGPPPLNLHPGLIRAHSRSGSQLPRVVVKEERQDIRDENGDIDRDRPAKRRKTSSGSLAVAAGPLASDSEAALGRFQSLPWSTVVQIKTADQIERSNNSDLPPLPDKPWATSVSRANLLQDARPPVRTRANMTVPNTPDCIDAPLDAPLFEHKRRADYFPWTGKHPEDVLNETHVKSGYFDRPPNPLEKELNTAKAPLYNAFKHKSGLESLSALFSLVLDAKAKHGAFPSTSTFKGPPPRVTLTEAKRKSWISDLANIEIPLRRLSKTIPQGIRGVALLDQCLQNEIPLSRAIWFIKCVGANEIRTLKRKGVNPTVAQGAETKWLREWTVNIEQFIESVQAQCGQIKWRGKIRYSIMLAARLYIENLLDRDHYLDWILKSFSTANPNNWPFCLVMIRLHRIDLIAFRKKGRQLAENLVLKYNLAQTSPANTLQPMAENLAAAIRALLTTRPNCFLMPDRWPECEKALTSCLENGDEHGRQAFEYLRIVNQRMGGNVSHSATSAASSSERIVEILDSFPETPFVAGLYDSLCQACDDQQVLMRKCLEWCISRYRTGKWRVFLSARLFKKLRKQGHDVDKVLLDFIFNECGKVTTNLVALKHFISELSRSQTFPCSKYMQWLSVRGLPRRGSMVHRVISVDSGTITLQESQDSQQLLTELCLFNSEGHLRNLRNSLLDQAGFDEDAETATLEQLQTTLTLALNTPDVHSTKRIWSGIPYHQLPWATRTRLSYWLRNEIANLAKAGHMDIPGKPSLPGSRSLTLERFQIARDVLEKAEDVAILADILRIASMSKQEDVLAACVDTINMHCGTLSAIGALEPLQLVFAQAYVTLRSMKGSMPLFATALISLCQQYPIKSAPVRALQQDLVRGDRGRAMTACSPFSDGVAESLQQAGATFYDDFEAILQTESNMNDQTMVRLTKVLIERIEKTQQAESCAHEIFSLCQLLARLKLCHKSQGEWLVKKWIAKIYGAPTQPMSSPLLFSLISAGCVQLDVVVDSVQQLPTSSPARLRLYAQLRRAFMDEPEGDVSDMVFYGFKLAVSKLITTRPVEMLEVVGSDETGQTSATPTKSMLINEVLSNSDLIKTLSKPAWLIVSQTLSENLKTIQASDPPEAQARELALSAGPLSLPFCSLRMRMLCQNAATKNDESIQDNIAAMLCATVADPKSLLSASPHSFQTLLRATGPVISGKVKSNIEQSFFKSLPKFLQSKVITQLPPPSAQEMESAAVALQQVRLVNTDGNGSAQPSGIGGMIEKLTIYMKCLGPASTPSQAVSVTSPVSATVPVLPADNDFLIASLDALWYLLQMLCFKRSAFSSSMSQPSPAVAKSMQQDQIKLVGLLISIGTHPCWSSLLMSLSDEAQRAKIRDTTDFAFDVAAVLVDDMTDESRTFCARMLKEKTKDERVRWLLGSINSFGSVQSHDMGSGYQVVHESKGVLGEWKPKTWELLESSGSNDGCLGLGLFGARKA